MWFPRMVVAVIALTLSTGLAPGQRQDGTRVVATACEYNSSVLSGVHQAVAAEPGTVIIAIARLGTGERRRDLNSRRLHNVRVFLTEVWKQPPNTIVLAEGEHTTGLGRVEFYIGGRLFDVIGVKTNGDLPIGVTCEETTDRRFYPAFERAERSRRN